jgi:hypothetical protein
LQVMDSKHKQSQPSPVEWPALEFAKKLLEASLVLTAFLYVVGWSYIYGYFRAFGITLQLVGFGVQDTIIHSFRAISANALSWLGFSMGALLVTLCISLLLHNAYNLTWSSAGPYSLPSTRPTEGRKWGTRPGLFDHRNKKAPPRLGLNDHCIHPLCLQPSIDRIRLIVIVGHPG